MARIPTVSPRRVAETVTINPSSVAAGQGLDVTATVKGLRPGSPVVVHAPALENHLVICNAHCATKDQLKFRLVNPTSNPIDPANQTFYVVQF
jgi:hypothetical protein